MARKRLLEVLGAVTMVCFVDDDVICEEYSVAEEIFLLMDTPQGQGGGHGAATSGVSRSPAPPTAVAMSPQSPGRKGLSSALARTDSIDRDDAALAAVGAGGKWGSGAGSSGAGVGAGVVAGAAKGMVLDLHANPQASGSRFEDPQWWRYLPSLKPLGLDALLTFNAANGYPARSGGGGGSSSYQLEGAGGGPGPSLTPPPLLAPDASAGLGLTAGGDIGCARSVCSTPVAIYPFQSASPTPTPTPPPHSLSATALSELTSRNFGADSSARGGAAFSNGKTGIVMGTRLSALELRTPPLSSTLSPLQPPGIVGAGGSVSARISQSSWAQGGGGGTHRGSGAQHSSQSQQPRHIERALVRHIRHTLPLEFLRELAEEIGFEQSDVRTFQRVLEVTLLHTYVHTHLPSSPLPSPPLPLLPLLSTFYNSLHVPILGIAWLPTLHRVKFSAYSHGSALMFNVCARIVGYGGLLLVISL